MIESLLPSQIGRRAARIVQEVERAIVGKHEAVELMLTGMLAKGHILIEDNPGLAKTLLARSFSQALGLDFARLQFTPDLMPADVTGASIYNIRESDLVFRPGPIFANLVLGDEINRAPPKTQSALLEAMAEEQVTVEGETRRLPLPFLVVATENPIEFEGTYPLPEAQLDRFMLRMSVGYPDHESAATIVLKRLERRTQAIELDQVMDKQEFLAMQDGVESVHVDAAVIHYIVDIVESTRLHKDVSIGSSPRGSLALVSAARARAAIRGRDYVTPEDVKSLAGPCLAHRLELKPETWVRGADSRAILAECLLHVNAPPTEPEKGQTDSSGSLEAR